MISSVYESLFGIRKIQLLADVTVRLQNAIVDEKFF